MPRERSQSVPASSSIHNTGVEHRITTTSPPTTMHRRSQAQNSIAISTFRRYSIHGASHHSLTPPFQSTCHIYHRHFPTIFRPTIGSCVAMAAHQWNRHFASRWPIGWVVHYMSDVGRSDLRCPSSLRCVLEFFAGVRSPISSYLVVHRPIEP